MTDAISLLRKLVATDSVFPHEAALAHFLSGELERAGFIVEMQRFGGEAHDAGGPRFNVLATRGNMDAGAPLLLYGHMDTVPPYGYREADRDPLRLEEREGKLLASGLMT